MMAAAESFFSGDGGRGDDLHHEAGSAGGDRRDHPMSDRDGLDANEMPAQNPRHRAAPHGEGTSRTGAPRASSIMLVELVDEIGERDMNVRELHEALARLLVRYHAKTHNPPARLA